MPVFEIKTPNGTYEVTAPDEDAALEALEAEETQTRDASRSVGTRVDDLVRGVADTASFGFADEAAAGMGALTGVGGKQGDYAGNVAAERERDANGGWERMGGQVLGALLNPASAARSVGRAALQGAGYGTLYGLGSGEGDLVERAPSAAVGGMMGGAAGGIVRGAANALQSRAVRKMIPSNEQLQKWTRGAYQASEAAGDIIPAGNVTALAQRITSDLAEFGYDPSLQPGAAAVVRRLSNLSGQPMTLKGLDTLRKLASNGFVQGNKSNNAAIEQIIGRIDEASEGLAGSPALMQGRDYARRLIKSEGLDRQTALAELRAAGTNSGANTDNQTRQRVMRMLERPRGLTPAEKKAAENVVRGTTLQNVMRSGGKKLSGTMGAALGGGLGSYLGPFGAAAGVAAVPALGRGMREVADRMSAANVGKLSETIRSGGLAAADIAKLARSGKLPLKAVKAIEAAERQFRNRAATIAAMYADRLQEAP